MMEQHFKVGDLVQRKSGKVTQIGRIERLYAASGGYGRRAGTFAYVAWIGGNRRTIGYNDPDKHTRIAVTSLRLSGVK